MGCDARGEIKASIVTLAAGSLSNSSSGMLQLQPATCYIGYPGFAELMRIQCLMQFDVWSMQWRYPTGVQGCARRAKQTAVRNDGRGRRRHENA